MHSIFCLIVTLVIVTFGLIVTLLTRAPSIFCLTVTLVISALCPFDCYDCDKRALFYCSIIMLVISALSIFCLIIRLMGSALSIFCLIIKLKIRALSTLCLKVTLAISALFFLFDCYISDKRALYFFR